MTSSTEHHVFFSQEDTSVDQQNPGVNLCNFTVHEFHETCHSVTSYFMKKDSNNAVTPQRQNYDGNTVMRPHTAQDETDVH